MKLTTMALLTCALPMVSACVVEEPYHGPYHRTGYAVPSRVVIHTDDHDWDEHDYDYDHNRGHFCPPGQAKKGNC